MDFKWNIWAAPNKHFRLEKNSKIQKHGDFYLALK